MEKNLIGSFYQPKIVLIDVSLLNSLSKREMVCGYAEILKHSLILKNNFFKWLKLKSEKILKYRERSLLKQAIYRSCKIKLYFVKKDVKEKNLRMILNFGHTFAHAIEAQNNYSHKINHGEAVLIGMMMATKLSVIKKVCSNKVLLEILKFMKKIILFQDLKNILKKKF